MINQQSNRPYSGVLSSGTLTVNVPAPHPAEQGPLSVRIQHISVQLTELNGKLATLRGQLFGGGEDDPSSIAPQPSSVDSYTFEIIRQIADANSQVSSILNRL